MVARREQSKDIAIVATAKRSMKAAHLLKIVTKNTVKQKKQTGTRRE